MRVLRPVPHGVPEVRRRPQHHPERASRRRATATVSCTAPSPPTAARSTRRRSRRSSSAITSRRSESDAAKSRCKAPTAPSARSRSSRCAERCAAWPATTRPAPPDRRMEEDVVQSAGRGQCRADLGTAAQDDQRAPCARGSRGRPRQAHRRAANRSRVILSKKVVAGPFDHASSCGPRQGRMVAAGCRSGAATGSPPRHPHPASR